MVEGGVGSRVSARSSCMARRPAAALTICIWQSRIDEHSQRYDDVRNAILQAAEISTNYWLKLPDLKCRQAEARRAMAVQQEAADLILYFQEYRCQRLTLWRSPELPFSRACRRAHQVGHRYEFQHPANAEQKTGCLRPARRFLAAQRQLRPGFGGLSPPASFAGPNCGL